MPRLASILLALTLAFVAPSCSGDSSVNWAEVRKAFYQKEVFGSVLNVMPDTRTATVERFRAQHLAGATAEDLLEAVRSVCAKAEATANEDGGLDPEAKEEVLDYFGLLYYLYPVLVGERSQDGYLDLLAIMLDKREPSVLREKLLERVFDPYAHPSTFFCTAAMRNRAALFEAYRSVYLDSAEPYSFRRKALLNAETLMVKVHDALFNADNNVQAARQKTGKRVDFQDVQTGKVQLAAETAEGMRLINADFAIFVDDQEVILDNDKEPRELRNIAALKIRTGMSSRRWTCQERLEALNHKYPPERFQKKLPNQIAIEKFLKEQEEKAKEEKEQQDFTASEAYPKELIQEISEKIRNEQQDRSPSETYSEKQIRKMAVERLTERTEKKLGKPRDRLRVFRR
jgi:hypothetical protein